MTTQHETGDEDEGKRCPNAEAFVKVLSHNAYSRHEPPPSLPCGVPWGYLDATR